jgi:superfamily II DNA or RNA helicase
MKPYPDQQKSINEIFTEFQTKERLLFQLPTGGGKTAVFSFIAKRFIKEYQKKILVLAHREELINQTLNTLRDIGVSCESVFASKKSLKHNANAYVGMIQTLKNRLKNNPLFVKGIGLIIIDEAHLDLHKEVFVYFPTAKILAVTATPSSLKKINFTRCHRCKKEHETITECCNYETYEYTRKFSYSEIYEHIILGQSISQLILNDRLVRDLNYQIGGCNRSEFLIDSKTGDYDTKSTDAYFKQPNVVKNYEAICKGEKTIVFNSSTSTNLATFESFIDAGYENVRMLDSVNTKQSERKPILKWFKETPGAILLNCGVLTAGFDEPTIQAVIINRATLSLSLWLQMVGRGGRKCETIYKPHFKVIDLGGNIETHGKWSDEIDWQGIFYSSNENPKPKREALDQTKQCTNCGMIYVKNEITCPNCDYEEPKKEKAITDEVAVLVDEIPLPNGKKILDYCTRIGKDKNFAWTILINQILDLFIRHEVTFGTFKRTEKNGKFEQSMRNIIKEPYSRIQGSELEGTNLRTKAYIINKIKNKLEKYYEKRT